jgi:hypothetical protein
MPAVVVVRVTMVAVATIGALRVRMVGIAIMAVAVIAFVRAASGKQCAEREQQQGSVQLIH